MDNSSLYTTLDNKFLELKVQLAQTRMYSDVVTNPVVNQLMNNDYITMLNTLKPINLITELYHIINARSVSSAAFHTLKLLEAYELLYLWKISDFSDLIHPCVEIIVTLFKKSGDFVTTINNAFLNQGGSPLQSTNEEEDIFEDCEPEIMNNDISVEIKDEGIISKCVAFITSCLVKAGSSEEEKKKITTMIQGLAPLGALCLTSVVAIGLLFCGPMLQKVIFGAGIENLCHQFAMELRDWTVITSSCKSVWSLIADGLGNFLGFTYLDDNAQVRRDLITKVTEFMHEVSNLNANMKLNFTKISRDPQFFKMLAKKKKNLLELIEQYGKVSGPKCNIAGLKMSMDEAHKEVDQLEKKYMNLMSSLTGKQLPTTMFIGGPPGCGKTAFMLWVEEELENIDKCTLTVYTRNATDPYISNYEKQPIFKYDDFNQDKMETDIKEVNGIVSSAAYFINAPDLPSKGDRFESRYLLMGSNMIFPKPREVNCPEMLNRRTDYRLFAFSQYKAVEGSMTNNPPSREVAMENLVLYQRHIENPEDYNIYDCFTIDGREVPVIDLKIQTRKEKGRGGIIWEIPDYADFGKKNFDKMRTSRTFKELVQEYSVLEKTRAETYQEHLGKRLQKIDMLDQMMNGMNNDAGGCTKTLKVVESRRKKSIMFLGDAGVGKTQMARQYRTNKNQTNPDEDDPFLGSVERMRKTHELINTAYDNALDDTIVITSQTGPWNSYLNSLSLENRQALERRIEIYNFSYKSKGLIMSTKYNYADLENDYKDNNGQKRNTYVKIVNPQRKLISFEALEDEMLIVSKVKNNKIITHSDVMHVPINFDLMKNVVKINLNFNDADEITMSNIEIVKTQQNLVTLSFKMLPVFKKIKSSFIVSDGMEQGLRQLNNMKITSPVDYPIVVKFLDECIILIPDNDNNLVFAIVDENFEYELVNNKIVCKFDNEILWEEVDEIQQWYQFVLRRIPLPNVSFADITPPAYDFKKWSEHFFNFLKTIVAIVTTVKICDEIKEDKQARKMVQQDNDSIGYEDFVTHTGTKRNYKVDKKIMLADMSKEEYYQKQYDQKEKKKQHSRSTYTVLRKRFDNDMKLEDYYEKQANNKTSKKSHVKSNFRMLKPNLQNDAMHNDTSMDPQADNLTRLLSKQTFELGVIIESGAFKKLVFAIGLKKKLFVTVSHVLRNDLVLNVNGVYHKIICWKVSNDNEDKMFFIVPTLPTELKDLTQHIPVAGVHTSYENFPIIMSKPEFDKGQFICFEKYTVIMRQEVVNYPTKLGPRDGMYYTNQAYFTSMLVGAGDCGSPAVLIDSSRNSKFIGFHIASSKTAGLMTFLLRDDFDDYEEFVSMGNDSIELNEGKEQIALPFQQVILKRDIEALCVDNAFKQEIQNLCEVNSEISPLFEYVGIAGTIKNDKIVPNISQHTELTQLYPSPFMVEEESDIFSPAAFSSSDPRVKKEGSIYYRSINIYGQERPTLQKEDLKLLEEVAMHTANQYANVIAKSKGISSVLTISEAINGSPRYETLGALPRDTSVGYPQKFNKCFQKNGGTKNVALEFIESKQMWKIAENEAGRDLRDSMQCFKTAMRKGQKTCLVWSGSLKDEPVKMEKVEIGKTRAFWGCPFYYALVHRQYFGSISALEALNFQFLPSKVGINACSREWQGLYNYLTRVGYYGFDLDYQNWDGKVLKEEMQQIPKMDNVIFQRTDPNWCEEDDRMRLNIFEHLICPNLLVDHHILKASGGQMSGQPRTAGDNCKINLNRVKYAWIKLARMYSPSHANMDAFDRLVSIAIYGDDIVVMVHESCHSWFTPQNYATLMKEWNVVITSADKSSELKMRHISEMSFLKRGFIKNEDGNVIGPLEDKSFVKMLSFCKRNKRHRFIIGERIKFDSARIALTARSVLDEASLKGKVFFDSMAKHIITCADAFDINLSDISTWKDTFNRVYFGNVVPGINCENYSIFNGHKMHMQTDQEIVWQDRKFFSIEHYFYYELCRRYACEHAPAIVQIPTLKALKSFLHQLHIEEILQDQVKMSRVMKIVIKELLKTQVMQYNHVNYIHVGMDRLWSSGGNDETTTKGTNLYGILLKQALYEGRCLEN